MDGYKGIIVLYNDSTTLLKGIPQDMLAEQGVVDCATAVAEALSQEHNVILAPVRTLIEEALSPYTPSDWMIFNLCEGQNGRFFEESRAAWALEAMGYCFTGAYGDAIALSTNKAKAKMFLAKAGIPTPLWYLYRTSVEIPSNLPYPLIVKPVAEDGSIGITEKSVVHNDDALLEQVHYIFDHYRQTALVEQYITGREFSVGVWGNPPSLLPISELDFSDFDKTQERIISFAAKWEKDSFAYNHTPVFCPAHIDQTLSQRISNTVLNAWEALGCSGYGRVDLRMDEAQIYVLEVNCNPDISPDAGFFRGARAAGYTYKDMCLKILKDASLEYLNRMY